MHNARESRSKTRRSPSARAPGSSIDRNTHLSATSPRAGWHRSSPDKNGLARDGTDDLVTETVDCVTFDDLLVKHGIDRIDYLQIDTEGYD